MVEFWVEVLKNSKNGLKVRKNSLKVGFDSFWWVPFSGLVFVGGHNIRCRELCWGFFEVIVVHTIGHDKGCREVFSE